MVELNDDMQNDDMEFVKLFSSLDSVKASEDLKNSTLEAIFASAGEENGSAATGEKPEGKLVKFPKNRRNSRTLRVAGIAACLAIFGIGSFAYTMPTSYASVDDGETTLTIGINSLGMTVSADADSDKGKKLIEESDLLNKSYQDSIGTAATGIAVHSDEAQSTITLSVESGSSKQRASIKKGSSEAIEVSGYKKVSKSTTSSTKDSSKASTLSTSSDSQNDATDLAIEDDEEDVASFEVNTEKAKAKSESEQASEQPADKYRPLSDDTKKGDATQPADNSQQEEAAPAQEQQASESSEAPSADPAEAPQE